MKKLVLSTFILIATLFTMVGCIKQNTLTIKELQVEFDAASWNARGAGVTWPVLNRVPPYGMPVAAADPLITRASGTIRFRVNLIGAQQSTAQTINYSVVAASTTAVSGTHFTIPGTITIPANSSFGEAVVNILNPGVSSATPVNLVLEVTGNSLIKPATEINKIGLVISQN
ncbi:MAG: hypothetical protein C0446_02455 [Chitinophaga sp.]|nr:hypothetical protein [Chitinophaga sp.]